MSVDVDTTDTRICETCRVLVVYDPDLGAWVHPAELRAKFSRDCCDDPVPGSPARGHALRYGRGRGESSREPSHIHDAIPELAVPPGTPITAGTDGAYKLVTGERVRKAMGWGYLTTSGVYGLGTTVRRGAVIGGERDRATQAELRAIFYLLTRRIDTPAGPARLVDTHPIEVITDSLDAVEAIDTWQAGEEWMPRGYTLERPEGQTATLVRLAHLAYDVQDRLVVRWVRGHEGVPLNEGADALAKVARLWASGAITRRQAAETGFREAVTALHRHAAGL
jgi:ribonuclease HI